MTCVLYLVIKKLFAFYIRSEKYCEVAEKVLKVTIVVGIGSLF